MIRRIEKISHAMAFSSDDELCAETCVLTSDGEIWILCGLGKEPEAREWRKAPPLDVPLKYCPKCDAEIKEADRRWREQRAADAD